MWVLFPHVGVLDQSLCYVLLLSGVDQHLILGVVCPSFEGSIVLELSVFYLFKHKVPF